MAEQYDWHKAIDFLSKESEAKADDYYVGLCWRRLQMGHRTNDLLMTIEALDTMKNEAASNSPEWGAALKWLAYQRARASNLMLDMINAQVEAGNRTPELLNMIRAQANAEPEPEPPPPEPIPEPKPEPASPPSRDF